MPEFRIEADAIRRAAISMWRWWSAVFLVMGLTALFFALSAAHLADGVFRVLAVAGGIGSFLTAYFLLIRAALGRAAQKTTFVLDNDKITRKRDGFPEITIAFSQIGSLGEEMNWLVVKSVAPFQRILIPRDVTGYDLIRTELAKHHSLSPAAKRLPRGVLLRAALLLLASMAAWAGILLCRDLRIVITAGVVAISALGFASYRIWINASVGRNKLLAAISIGTAWLTAAFQIYTAMRR